MPPNTPTGHEAHIGARCWLTPAGMKATEGWREAQVIPDPPPRCRVTRCIRTPDASGLCAVHAADRGRLLGGAS